MRGCRSALEAGKWRVKVKLNRRAKVELRLESLAWAQQQQQQQQSGRSSGGGGDGASFEPARKLREAAEHQRAVAAAQLETFRAGSYISTSTAGIHHATCRGGRASRLGCSKKNTRQPEAVRALEIYIFWLCLSRAVGSSQ